MSKGFEIKLDEAAICKVVAKATKAEAEKIERKSAKSGRKVRVKGLKKLNKDIVKAVSKGLGG
jgi:tRNA pseudouridine-54 N-methylase